MSESTDAAPTILFDGVCNLCDGTVRWVIAHDRGEKFRFASLQSRAARGVLEAAGAGDALPDSIVLVEGGRVRTRSDAAIGIARGLGFPWSLACVVALLPRALRDVVYDWVARNRYRWFGRQNACAVPTPELRARFLDADEPVAERANPPAGSAAGTAAGERAIGARVDLTTGAAATALRIVLIYFVLYILPFPLQALPYGAMAAQWLENGKQQVVAWLAKRVLGVGITVFPNGSGDTTYNYIEVATYGACALVLSLAWSVWRGFRPVGARTLDWVNVYVRFNLGVTLLGYGWAKFIPLQMPFPGPDRLLNSYGDSSPMGLLWTFIGASPPYQMFAGLCEIIGGGLLLWRRTTLAGALVSAGVMLNVAMLNYCYDVPVKLFSSHLLLMALFLLAPHVPRLVAVFFLNIPAAPAVLHPYPLRRAWSRWTVGTIKCLFIVASIVLPAFENWDAAAVYGFRIPPKTWQGTYRVESFTRGGESGGAVSDGERWTRFGISSSGVGAIQRADGTTRRQRMAVDEEKGTITITRPGDAAPIVLTYTSPEDGVMVVEGEFEGKVVSARLRKGKETEPFLTSRGFHWINEYPLNR